MAVFLHPQGLCESRERRRRDPHLGLRTRAPRARASARLQHLRPRLRRERRGARRPRHGQVRRAAVGRACESPTTCSSGRTPRSRTIRSRAASSIATPMRTSIGRGASLGANATILPGLSVGRDSMVGAGAVVTQPVPARAIVMGNPARIVGYVDTETPRRGGGGAVRASRASRRGRTRAARHPRRPAGHAHRGGGHGAHPLLAAAGVLRLATCPGRKSAESTLTAAVGSSWSACVAPSR